ncbi:MAG: [FeFe] hydrogenase H-cluster radical SAM maturase HydE [Rikenellaceae bacterium]
MQTTKGWIDQLHHTHTLPPEGYRAILNLDNPYTSNDTKYLHYLAKTVTQKIFGQKIFVRALIEITNRCANNCYYCGIRASNREVHRYTLTHSEIMESCHEAYNLGLRTFVLQGGEDPTMSDEWVVELVDKIHTLYPDCAITLSLGERSAELYQRLFDAGATRYLLRHESHNAELYKALHPSSMSLNKRLKALDDLKRIGYQTGTGVMVGAPHQTIDHIVEDIKYIERLRPEMVGIGAFIPHHATPFAEYPAGSVGMTLKLISIFRLINPRALIPATTALATLSKDGREHGILSGANVVMPNFSPQYVREDYALYDNKASFGSESGEGIKLLKKSLASIGYEISFDRGDYQ